LKVCCCACDDGDVRVGDGVVEGVAEDFEALQFGEGDAWFEERVGVGFGVDLESCGVGGGKADGLQFEGLQGSAVTVDVEKVDPVGSSATAENGPGDGEELKLRALGHDGEDVLVGVGGVEAIEPEAANMLSEVGESCECCVGGSQ
jgi:hypothetical protein